MISLLSPRADAVYRRAIDEIHSMAAMARERLGLQPEGQQQLKLKIVSDGLGINTKVFDIETGRQLEGITAITWSVNVDRMIATALVELIKIPVELITEKGQYT